MAQYAPRYIAMNRCQLDHGARIVTTNRAHLEPSPVRCTGQRFGSLMKQYITYCLYTWSLNLSVISLFLSLLITFPLCHLYHLFLPSLILGLFYAPLLQLINLNPALFFHFTFSHYFFFYSAFSLSLFYMEGRCIHRRPVLYKDFEIMLDNFIFCWPCIST